MVSVRCVYECMVAGTYGMQSIVGLSLLHTRSVIIAVFGWWLGHMVCNQLWNCRIYVDVIWMSYLAIDCGYQMNPSDLDP